MQQVHDPHLFHAAWQVARLTLGTRTGRQTFDHAIWVHATPTTTTLHTADGGHRYTRLTIPTTAPGTEWRHVIGDPADDITRVATSAVDRRTAAGQQDLAATRFVLEPAPDGKTVEIAAVDDWVHDNLRAHLRVRDVPWPEQLATLTDHAVNVGVKAGTDLHLDPALDAHLARVGKACDGVTRRYVRGAPDRGPAVLFTGTLAAYPSVTVTGLVS